MSLYLRNRGAGSTGGSSSLPSSGSTSTGSSDGGGGGNFGSFFRTREEWDSGSNPGPWLSGYRFLGSGGVDSGGDGGYFKRSHFRSSSSGGGGTPLPPRQPSPSPCCSGVPGISLTSASGTSSFLLVPPPPLEPPPAAPATTAEEQRKRRKTVALSRHSSWTYRRRKASSPTTAVVGSPPAGSGGSPGSQRIPPAAVPPLPTNHKSSLNRISDYASRYLDSIRPRWGGTGGRQGHLTNSSSSTSSTYDGSMAAAAQSSSDQPHVLSLRHNSGNGNGGGGGSSRIRNSDKVRGSGCCCQSRDLASVVDAAVAAAAGQHPPQERWFRHITDASNAYKHNVNRRYHGGGSHNGLDTAGSEGVVGAGVVGGGGAGSRSGGGDNLLGVPDLGDANKKGNPAARSHSFHESSGSSREPHPERQPSSPPEDRGGASSGVAAAAAAEGEVNSAFSKKPAGDLDVESGAAGGAAGASPGAAAGVGEGAGAGAGGGQSGSGTGNGQKKRYQRVEILKIAEPCPLIDPSQVVVTQGEILMADPVLTPIEKLRRKDEEVARALEEKQKIIAEILNVPLDEFDHLADMAAEPNPDKDAREVLLAALAQAKHLSELVNESLNLSEEAAVAASAGITCLSSPPSSPPAATTSKKMSSSPQAEEPPPHQPEDGPAASMDSSDPVLQGGSSSHYPPKANSSSIRSKRAFYPGPASDRLVSIANSMNMHLTCLLSIIQERDDERELLRKELQRSQEQVRVLLDASGQEQAPQQQQRSWQQLRRGAPPIPVRNGDEDDGVDEDGHQVGAAAASAADRRRQSSSRPVSYLSVEDNSSAPELSEKNPESDAEIDPADAVNAVADTDIQDDGDHALDNKLQTSLALKNDKGQGKEKTPPTPADRLNATAADGAGAAETGGSLFTSSVCPPGKPSQQQGQPPSDGVHSDEGTANPSIALTEASPQSLVIEGPDSTVTSSTETDA